MKYISDHIKSILALVIVLSGLAYFFVDRFVDGSGNDQIVIAIVAMVSSVTGYYYGTTSGSSKKDETISDLTKTKN